MNAITPPKLMPPFQRTAASGMFPTEHTNEMIATSGPAIGPQNDASSGCSTRKKRLPKRVRHPRSHCAGNQQAANDVEPDCGPIHHKIMADRCQAGDAGPSYRRHYESLLSLVVEHEAARISQCACERTAWPLAARSQQPMNIPRLCFLTFYPGTVAVDRLDQPRPPAHFDELTPLDDHALAPFLRIKLIGQFCWPIGCECQRTGACSSPRARPGQTN